MKKLLIFDKVTKQIVGKNNFWEDHFTLEDNWETFDATKHTAVIVDKSVKEFEKKLILQPADYSVSISEFTRKTAEEIQAQIEAEKPVVEEVIPE